jgi:hypothetical protein
MELYDFDADRRRVTVKEWSKRKSQTIRSSKFWLQRFPLISWLKSYSWTFAFYDVVAGVTVGLLVLPQCLAAAAVAGLPPQVYFHRSLLKLLEKYFSSSLQIHCFAYHESIN